ncbi:7TM diverse intracellular signaling domain-containing protein [Nibrella viscosa]|uniref:histidine kinase n=1 Tax=Nibrella viscosa TaxID=1084524 RepID=A0ABP8KLG4_9BACT
MRFRFIMLFIVVSLCAGRLHASQPVILSPGHAKYIIGRHVEFLPDSLNNLTLEDVQKPAMAQQFHANLGEVPNLVSANCRYWFRFRVSSRDFRPESRHYLEIAFGNIKEINLYIIDRNGRAHPFQAGDQFGSASRLISFNTYVFPLPLQPGDWYTVYIRIDNRQLHNYFPLIIWEESQFQKYAQTAALLWGGYWGVLILMFLYHIIIFLFTHIVNYLYLGFYLLSYIFYEACRGSNLGIRYLWPDVVWLAEHGLGLFSLGVFVTFVVFYSRVLNLRVATPRLYRTLWALCSLSSMLVIINLLEVFPLSLQFVALMSSCPLVVGMFAAGVLTWRQGQLASRFYVLASMCYAFGFILFVLNRVGIIPGMSFLTHYSQNIGSLLEFIFMSVGLAAYIRNERLVRRSIERQREIAAMAAYEQQIRKKVEMEEALMAGQIQERRRVADELHDQLGSVLFSIRTRLGELKTADKQPAIDRNALHSLLQSVQDAYDDIRLIAHNFWPTELEERGLGSSLNKLTSSLNRAGKTSFVLQLSGKEDQLNRSAKFHVYCVCLELVTNILKHAQASEATIRFTVDDTRRWLKLSVRDDGAGFDPDLMPSGKGLRSIQERVNLLNGTVFISSLPEGGGTWVQIQIPIDMPDFTALVPGQKPNGPVPFPVLS